MNYIGLMKNCNLLSVSKAICSEAGLTSKAMSLLRQEKACCYDTVPF